MEQCPRCGEVSGEYQTEDMDYDTSMFGDTIEYRTRYACVLCGHEWDEVNVQRIYGDDVTFW